jgi:hypothetical protein
MPEEKSEGGSSRKKDSLTGLAKKLSRMSAEKRKAAIEESASLAAVSLKVSRAFVEAVPVAAKTLSADDLRAWAELGRRIAMANAEGAVGFFESGVGRLEIIAPESRKLVFQIISRQLLLSSSIALETYEQIPDLAKKVDDSAMFSGILELGAEIANRSAKHSSDFLNKTPEVAETIGSYGEDKARVASAVFGLASSFAVRTGGMTADLWTGMPDALRGLSAEVAVRLLERGGEFLEYGGSVTLHFVSAGASTLRRFDPVFDDWCETADRFGKHGNAVLIAFLRWSPPPSAQARKR